MTALPLNIFLPQRFDRERIAYLHDLENREYALLHQTIHLITHPDPRPLIVGRADNPSDLRALLSIVGGYKNLILLTRSKQSTFPNQIDQTKFFTQGGLAIFDDGWHDYAFRRMLRELHHAQNEKRAPTIPHYARIVVHKLGATVFGLTQDIGFHHCTALLFNAEALGQTTSEFSLHIAPGTIAHGKCKIAAKSSARAKHLTEVEFTEFDGVSQSLLEDLVNCEFSLQCKAYGQQPPPDRDVFQLLQESITPILDAAGISFSILPSPFDMGCFVGENSFLIQLMTKILLKAATQFPVPGAPLKFCLQMRENREKLLCLFLSVPIENQAKLDTSTDLVLDSNSPLAKIISSEHTEYLRSIGLRVEQYLVEPHEHLAFCLEEPS